MFLIFDEYSKKKKKLLNKIRQKSIQTLIFTHLLTLCKVYINKKRRFFNLPNLNLLLYLVIQYN